MQTIEPLGNVLAEEQGAIIKEENEFELDPEKADKYQKSTIKLFKEGDTLETVQASLKIEVIKPYREIDTRVKPIQQRTDAELRKPDQELIESEMAELIKEARHKIKPVIHAMSKEELDSLCIDLETAKKNN